MSSKTEDKPDTKPTKPLPLWHVIVHNDDVNTFEHVITCLVAVVHLDVTTAFKKTFEVDKEGLSIVYTTHKERAELIRDQLQSFSLTCTIEPAP